MNWRCHAHPPELNGRECGHVNEDGAHAVSVLDYAAPVLGSIKRLEYCGKCGRTKKASDDVAKANPPKRRVPVVDAASYEDACAAQREVTCVHHTGTAWGMCKAGVQYDAVSSNPDGGASVFACVQDEAWEERGRPTCLKYERPREVRP